MVWTTGRCGCCGQKKRFYRNTKYEEGQKTYLVSGYFQRLSFVMRCVFFVFFLLFFYSGFAQNYYLFIGTYTGTGSKGIYVYQFNAATGDAKWISNTDTAANPSYLALSPTGNYLYAVNETGGNQPGSVSAFAFDKKTGTLSFIHQQPRGGDHPGYLSIEK